MKPEAWRTLKGRGTSLAIECVVALAAPHLCAGCATVTQGASQNLAIITDPPGAACVLSRDGKVAGVVNPTPGSVYLEKRSAEIMVVCSKTGFVDASTTVKSTVQAATFGNILPGGVVGLAVDAASGATSAYDPQISIRLVPDQPAHTQDDLRPTGQVRHRHRDRCHAGARQRSKVSRHEA